MSAGKSTHRVVIIGGGFGGLETAKALARSPVHVDVLDRNNHHLFQPLLYQVASAGLSPADIAIPIRSVLGRQANTAIRMAEVTAVDREGRRVLLRDGSSVAYDHLVVAAGARTNYFGNDHWGEHSISLKTVEDALDVRRNVLLAFERAEQSNSPDERRRLLTFVVIGAGPTGVELAGAISELNRRVMAADYRNIRPDDVRVVLIEMADRVLSGFHPSLSEEARRQLESLHVEVRTSTAVKDIQKNAVELADETIHSSSILWTAGVSPVALTQKLGVDLVRGRVPVEKDCSLPGHPEIFVIGDMAYFEGPNGPLPGVSPVAMQQGRFVAKAFHADLAGRPRGTFEYRDKGMMATVGRSRAVAEVGNFRFGGFVAWLLWLVVHLVYLVGFKNRISVLFGWIWQYAAYRRGARLITYNPNRAQTPVVLLDPSLADVPTPAGFAEGPESVGVGAHQ